MREFGLDETALTEEEAVKRRLELKTLIKMGKTRGFLTHQEINDHLPNDIGEQNDLVAEQPELASRLRGKLDAWLKSTGARIPQPDPRFDAAKKEQQQQQIRNKRKPALERQHARFLAEDFQPNKDWWGSKLTRD